MSGSGGPLRETRFASEQDTQEPHGEWQLNVVYASLGGAQELLKCPGAYVAKTKDPVRFGY